jgi:large subunit ribosomal protein L4
MPEKGDQYDVVRRTIGNIPNVKMLMANYLNVRDLLGYDKVVMPVGAIDAINSYLG